LQKRSKLKKEGIKIRGQQNVLFQKYKCLKVCVVVHVFHQAFILAIREYISKHNLDKSKLINIMGKEESRGKWRRGRRGRWREGVLV
jgi:hypothetical protein